MYANARTAVLSASAGFLVGMLVFFPSPLQDTGAGEASNLLAFPALRSAASVSSLRFAPSVRGSTAVRATERFEEPVQTRRDLLTGAAGIALAGAARASHADVGVAARMFKEGASNPTGFDAFAGEDFSLLLPSKWNPSKEKDFPGVVLRYEDNFDAVNSLVVIKQKTDKASVDGYGKPEEFLNQFSYLLGKQSYSGKTISEGGFAPDRVSAVSVLDVKSGKDKKGRATYDFNLLGRTADGDEGGRHQLIKAVVSNGNLFILKIQVGDKRWFKGVNKEAEGAFNSFLVA